MPVDLAARTDADLPESAGELMATVEAIDLPAGAEADATGEWAVWHDFNQLNEQALHKAELLSGLPTVILLFVAFGSAIAAGLPLLLAVAGIAVGFALLHLGTGVTPLSVWSMNFSMMIGLAVGIDYSLFIVSRYREEREDGKDPLDAVAATLATAGKAVFLSALTVVLSLAAIFLVPVMVFRSMAFGMILSVVATAAASLTLLPAVLVALGDRVLVAKGDDDPDRAAEGRWARWTAAAMRRPGATLAAGLGLLLLLAAPALGMRLGMPAAGVVDTGHQSRDGYDAVVEHFGDGAPAPMFATVPADQADAVVALAAADPGVVDARIVAEPAASGRTVVRITPSTTVDSEATSDLVHRLRDGPRPGGPRRAARRARHPEHRPHRRPARLGPPRHRGDHARGVRAAAGGVPQPVDRRHVDPVQPRRCGRQLRVRHPRVPARHRRRTARHRASGLRRRLGPAVLLRPALRSVDGLPAVPARRDQGASRRHRRRPARRPARASPAPAGPSPTPPSS